MVSCLFVRVIRISVVDGAQFNLETHLRLFPLQDVFLMIRRKKMTIFTDAKDDTTVLELKKMIEGEASVFRRREPRANAQNDESCHWTNCHWAIVCFESNCVSNVGRCRHIKSTTGESTAV